MWGGRSSASPVPGIGAGQQSHRSIVIVIDSNTTVLTTSASVVKLKTKVCKVFTITEKAIESIPRFQFYIYMTPD